MTKDVCSIESTRSILNGCFPAFRHETAQFSSESKQYFGIVNMKFITLFLAVAPVLAVPFNEPGNNGGFPGGNNGGFSGGNNGNNGINGGNGGNGGNRGPVCASGLLYTQAQCCKTDILNLADLDCKSARK